MTSLLIALLALPICQDSRPSAKVDWERFRLDNGVAVSVLHVKGAARQSTFTFLPLGLLSDDKDRAQFSHLVEHMIIRSTDPIRLGVAGIMLNGETMSSTIRLESIAEPDAWKKALERHVRWLSIKSIDAKAMSKEKANIAAEVRNTVQRGYTHKWALAAWNQVIRHGKAHARVIGDVADAIPDQVNALLPQVLKLDRAHIYSAGLVSAAKIKELLAAQFSATNKKGSATNTKGSATSKKAESRTEAAAKKLYVSTAKKTVATWDLPGAQVMLWFPLAGKQQDEYLAAEVMAHGINMKLRGARKLKSQGVIAMASVERLPDGTGRLRTSVLLSASCKASLDLPEVERQLLAELSALATTSLGFTLLQVKMQSAALPDFASIRKRLKGRMAEFFEANVVLQLAYRELNSGLSASEYAKAIAKLDKDRVVELYAAWLQPQQVRSLFLTPKPKNGAEKQGK